MLKRITMTTLVLCVAAILAFAGCKQVDETADGGDSAVSTKKPDSGAADAGGQASADETVIASMAGGKENITWRELDQVYHIERMRSRLDEEQIHKLLDNLVRQHLVYLDGMDKGYDKDPEYIRQIEMAKRQYMNRIAMRKLAQEPIEVTDEEIKAYYDSHPDEFHMLRVQYIMFPLRQYGNDVQKARVDAEKALAAVRKGQSLEDVSQELLNRSRPFQLNLRKGQASFFGEVFDNELWSIEPGSFTGIIEASQGLIIAQKLDEVTQTFEEAKAFIKSEMTKEKSMKRMENYYSGLESKYNLKIDEKAIDAKMNELKEPDMPGPGDRPANHPPIPPPAMGTVGGDSDENP